jgi:hypothetical protein
LVKKKEKKRKEKKIKPSRCPSFIPWAGKNGLSGGGGGSWRPVLYCKDMLAVTARSSCIIKLSAETVCVAGGENDPTQNINSISIRIHLTV